MERHDVPDSFQETVFKYGGRHLWENKTNPCLKGYLQGKSWSGVNYLKRSFMQENGHKKM